MSVHSSHDEERLHLMTRVAWMYFIEGVKQEDIAEALGLNRMKVNRLLSAARDQGIVEIKIRAATDLSGELTQSLRERFGLQEVHIVPRALSHSAAVASVGHALGQYLNDRLKNGMTIGIASGRSSHALFNGLRDQAYPDLDVVGLKGCLSNEGKIIPHETVARMAHVLGANSYQIAAPSHARNRDEHALFSSLPMIHGVMDRARRSDLAILTASRVVDDGGMVRYGFITREDAHALREAGAVGVVLGMFVNQKGEIIDHPLNDQQIGLRLDDLRRIPKVILTCAGEGKVPPLAAALQMGFANVLFTDEVTAEGVMALA